MNLVTHNIDEIIDRHPEADLIRHILNLPAISTALRSGAYIAGGFARTVYLGKRVSTYLFGQEHNGDIDLFFSSRDQIDAVTHVTSGKSHRSFGGNASECMYVTSGKSHRSFGGNASECMYAIPRQILMQYAPYTGSESYDTSFHLQIVDKAELILPIREQLARFDFVNVRCAFNDSELLVDDRIMKLETVNLLQICNSSSPYLSSRINKYIKKGYLTITDDSREHITDWIIRALAGEFDAFYPEQTRNPAFGKIGINTLISRHAQLLRNEDLIMLIGMFKQDYSTSKYGPSVEIDMALHIIEKRNREKNESHI